MDFYETVLHCRFIIPSVNHNDCNGDSFLCVFQVDCMTMNSHGFSATSRTLFQVKNNVFIWDNAYTAIRYKSRCNPDEELPIIVQWAVLR